MKQRVEAKEQQKARAQKLLEEEETSIRETSNKFASSVESLNEVVTSIKEFENSNTAGEVEKLENKREDLGEKVKAKRKEYSGLKPELERLSKIVDDQEREYKNLEENIQLLESTEKIRLLEKDLEKLEEEMSNVEGSETADQDIERLSQRKEALITENAELEGRRREIVENMRSLERSLSKDVYKNVDEEYRIASIKYDTTEQLCKEIGQYQSALDKALQRFHSIKITEINTIIRDLWNLTYKGEDITNIQIQSGEEAGSRSSRSYNYRVVMSKGGSKMDMRGRCSAGQRVLASIVIRLALAEVFCVNFGVRTKSLKCINVRGGNPICH